MTGSAFRSVGAVAAHRARAALSGTPLVTFPALWLIGVAVAQIHVFSVQRPWSQLTWAVVAVVPLAFVLGGFLGSTIVQARLHATRHRPEVWTPRRRRIRFVLVGFLFLGWLEEIHQWHAAGGVPLLASNIDATRAAQPGGLTIVLTDLLTVTAILALVLPRRLFSRSALPELCLALAALAGFALAGGRVTVVLPLAVAGISRTIYWGAPRLRIAVVTVIAVVAAISGVFFLRESQHRSDPFARELYGSVLPATPMVLRPLIPIHLALATNYEALARVVDYFPYEAPYGFGRYDALGFDHFVPQARNLGSITAQLSGPWVTSTVAGPFWADGGIPIVAFGLAVIGLLTTVLYACARRTRMLRYALAAGHFYFLALFGVYTNLWTQEVDWLLDVPLLFLLGAYAEGPLREALSFREFRDTEAPIEERRRLRLRVYGAFLAVVALLATTGVAEAWRTPGAPLVGADERPASTLLHPVAVVSLPVFVTRRAQLFATNVDEARGAMTLWAAERRPQGLLIRKLVWRCCRLPRVWSWRVQVGERGSLVFAVSTWKGKPAVVTIRPTATGARVRVAVLDSPATIVLSMFAHIPAAPATRRDYAIGTWSGAEPQLIVIDRPARDLATVRVYSIESGFAHLIHFERTLYSLSGPDWSTALVRLNGHELGLAAFVRAGPSSGSGLPEIHVEGMHPLTRLRDVPLALPNPTSPVTFLAGSFPNKGAFYVVNIERRTVSVFQ